MNKQIEKYGVMKGLTKPQLEAIEYLGTHRKSETKVGKHIKTRVFYSLKKKYLVMWINFERKTCMLTFRGELIWTAIHPHSKYRVNYSPASTRSKIGGQGR